MNRRDFFKAIGTGLLTTLFSGLESGDEKMELGDIFVKMATNKTLTPQELDFLKISMKQTQLNNSFVSSLQNGTGTIKVKHISSDTGFFNLPPSGISLRVTRDTNTTISDSTETDISWENEYYDDADMWKSSSPTIITIQQTGRYVVTGRTLWTAATNTGFRIATVYDTSVGVSPAIVTSTDYPASTLHRNLFYDEVNLTKGQNLSMMVKQFSGSNATLEYARLTIRLLKAYDSEPASDG